jgi:hypothetical protein
LAIQSLPDAFFCSRRSADGPGQACQRAKLDEVTRRVEGLVRLLDRSGATTVIKDNLLSIVFVNMTIEKEASNNLGVPPASPGSPGEVRAAHV